MLYILFSVSIAFVLVLLLVNRVPLNYTLRNLTVRWITSALTLVAFVIVVGLMVVMLAFTTGMKRMTEGSGEPSNVLVLSEGSDDEVVSTITAEAASDLEGLPLVASADGKQKLASRESYLIVNQPVAIQRQGKPRGHFLTVRGVFDVGLARRVHEVEVHEGGAWFSQAGTQANPDPKGQNLIQVVLGEGIAQALAKDRSPESPCRLAQQRSA